MKNELEQQLLETTNEMDDYRTYVPKSNISAPYHSFIDDNEKGKRTGYAVVLLCNIICISI